MRKEQAEQAEKENVGAWPDTLRAPTPERIQTVLAEFWRALALLPDLIQRREHLLAERNTTHLRELVLEMMLALNGIAPPTGTKHLNGYLGESQLDAIQKTLLAPSVSGDSWLGRAVGLLVIYRWYAPQLVAKFSLDYPQTLEAETLALLERMLPDWPTSVTTHAA